MVGMAGVSQSIRKIFDFPRKEKKLTLDGGFQTRRFRLKLIAKSADILHKDDDFISVWILTEY